VGNDQSGWVKRRSGILVPRKRPHVRRASAVAGVVLASVAFASPIAGAVSAWSRAAIDIVALIRTVLEANDEPTAPVCGSRRP
jgi:hypothetical protein